MRCHIQAERLKIDGGTHSNSDYQNKRYKKSFKRDIPACRPCLWQQFVFFKCLFVMTIITLESCFFPILFYNSCGKINHDCGVSIVGESKAMGFRPVKIIPEFLGSIVACVNKRDGTVLKAGTASQIIGPVIVDPTHVMLGAGCGDWGVCIYLSLADASQLKSDLDRLIAEHTQRG